MYEKSSNCVGILWDIENITPANGDTLLMDGLAEFAEGLGRVSASFAYADWSIFKFAKLSKSLSSRQFRMVHTPHKGGSGKNSADMALVSDAMELLQFYPHINVFIIITGDSDFRPLLQTMRKNGKLIHVVYDMKRAPQDLLALADSFVDYRDLPPNNDEDDDDEEDSSEAPVARPREYWFERLAEAADLLAKDDKSTSFGAVKIRMRILNRDFNETALGYKRFSHFVMAAAKAKYVRVRSTEGDAREIESAKLNPAALSPGGLQAALTALTEELVLLNKHKPDALGWHSFNQVGSALQKRGIDLKSLGFNRFKKFIQSAEARGLVEQNIKEDGYHYVRLS